SADMGDVSRELVHEKVASPLKAKRNASERLHAHDLLMHMRKIGWRTRSQLREVYHHRRK
ncbi:MAG: hypothetical protein Greene041662_957, partial [Candidatus Peregrinibacteria bacterium Greene0416_62]